MQAKPAINFLADLRQQDPQRLALSWLHPMPQRQKLWGLLALDAELAKVRFLVSEALVGEVRLQWWSEALSNTNTHTTQPLLQALRPLLAQYPALLGQLLALIDGYKDELHYVPQGEVSFTPMVQRVAEPFWQAWCLLAEIDFPYQTAYAPLATTLALDRELRHGLRQAQQAYSPLFIREYSLKLSINNNDKNKYIKVITKLVLKNRQALQLGCGIDKSYLKILLGCLLSYALS